MDKKIRDMRVIPFEIDHCLQMNIREEEAGFYSHQNFKKWLLTLKDAGNCFSVFYNDEIVFLGGVRILHDGVGEAWIICSKKIRRFVSELYFYSEKILNALIETNKLYRVQVHVKATWHEAIRFVENLGFEKEGLLRKYISGEDYFIYARVA